MTDMPVFGILCCGKEINELAESVRGCGCITGILKDAGFVLGGYHTCLVKKDDTSSSKLCESKLYHLCRNCDVVFTVGAEGFAHDDILPEITMKLCDSEAVFFTTNLCGLANISNYDSKKRKQKVFPPSRSRAGITQDCLVLNIRNDIGFIKALVPSLLPSLSFAAACICGKDAFHCKSINDSLKELCCSDENGRKIIFEKIQNIETNNR